MVFWLAPVQAQRLDQNLLTREHAEQRARQISDVGYRLSFKLDSRQETYTGKVDIDFHWLALDNAPLTIDFEQGTISHFSINGKKVDPQYRRWFVTLPKQHLKPGQNRVTIGFERPYSNNGNGLHRLVDETNSDVYLFSDFQPYSANKMFPLFDQPDLKARFTLSVEAPAHWQLISTTLPSRVASKAKTKHWSFHTTDLIPAYVFSLHAGRYHVWQDQYKQVPLRLFARQSVAEDVDAGLWFDATKKTMAFFEQYFAIDYPFGKYDQVIVPQYNNGAMENVAAVTFNEDFYVPAGPMTEAIRVELIDTIAHEMAHMWFGNLVTMQWWNGLWLNESVTSYLAVVAMEQAMGIDSAWDAFHANFKRWGYEADTAVTTHPIELKVRHTEQAESLFDGITYGKGAAVIAQLSRYVGPEAFRQGLSNYLKQHSYQNTTLTDFTDALGKAGKKDLSQWSRQWLFQAGVNTLRTEITCDDGSITKAIVYQSAPKQHPTLRKHKVQVGFYGIEEDEVTLMESFALDVTGSQTSLPQASGLTCPQFAFANVDDWGYVKVELNAVSLLFLQDHLGGFPTPRLRMALWQSLWDKVLSLELSLSEFVSMALRHLPGEPDDNVLTLVNEILVTAFDNLSRLPDQTAKVQTLKRRIERLAWEQWRRFGDDVGKQAIGYEQYIAVAHSEFGLGNLSDLLDGKQTISGMQMTQSKRWDMVYRLNQYQHGDHLGRYKRELKRAKADPDEFEPLLALRAQPVAKYKQLWLDLLIKQARDYDFDTLRWLMEQIFPASQAKVYATFQQQLLEALPKLNHTGNLPYLVEFAEQMIGGFCSPQSVARLNQAVERYSHLPAGALNAIKVAAQKDQQCIDIGQRLQR